MIRHASHPVSPLSGAGRPAPTGLVGLTHLRGCDPKYRQRRPPGCGGGFPFDPRASAVLQRAGASLPPNPGELIESHAMETLLEQAKSAYDLVVVDTPPLTAVSDAFPLLGKVDGVIIVGRVGRNRRDVAQRLHETLMGAGAPLLGVVANGFKPGRLGGYGYGYSYDYAAGVKGGTTPADGARRPAGRPRTARARPRRRCRPRRADVPLQADAAMIASICCWRCCARGAASDPYPCSALSER